MKKFLLTCDDGYSAPGLLASKKAVEDLGEIFVYATETQNTAGGSKMTPGKPIKYYHRNLSDGTPCISVDGTPVDVVFFALGDDLKNKKIDLCISGINIGEQISNSAIIMSGTCSAAFIAACLGIPSIAIGYTPKNEHIKYKHHDTHDGFEFMFDFPQKVLRKIVVWILKNGLDEADYWNINLPNKPTDKIKVVRAIKTGYYRQILTKKKDHFILWGEPDWESDFPKDTDALCIRDSIVITPCSVDFTDHRSLENLKKLENDLKLEV